ncbi:PucR family transcriptional regulator [Acetobacterium sp. UBA5834]|jgi:hypothetical protein|uniref:PucR family transcriptional regulator n=1 Tax=Acetobacterium sp. UBA5834 TaxID=1945907 RepID=UPI00257F93B3|nr:helix-turn-helix domain-containing protein [Acetobacterium sp. UBA5834]
MPISQNTSSVRKDIILNALIERKGLQYLTDVAAEVLENPIFIFDISGKILAKSHIKEYKEVWEVLFPDGHLNSDNRRITERAGVIKQIMDDDSPVFGKFEFSRFRFLGCRIRDNDNVVAVATLVEMNPFGKEDSDLLITICKSVLFELLYRERTAMQKIPYFGLLKDIIERTVSESEILERCKVLNLSIHEKMRLIEIRFPGYLSNSLSLNLLRESLILSIPIRYCIIYSDTLLLIMAENLINESILERIKKVFYHYEIRIGISSKFTNILSVQSAFQELRAIQSVCQKLQVFKEITFYEEIIMYHFMEMASKEFDLRKFCLPVIAQIEEYDQYHSTFLKQCLEGYLECGRNTQKAAEQLHIHKNTLYYRLKRIEELFSLDLNDENLCFNLQLSLRVQHFAD